MGFGRRAGADRRAEGRIGPQAAAFLRSSEARRQATSACGTGGLNRKPCTSAIVPSCLDDAHLSFGLDALDQHRHAELAAHRRDAFDQYRRALLDAETEGERAVDLDAVEREAEEIAEARIAGAEVVERNATGRGCARRQACRAVSPRLSSSVDSVISMSRRRGERSAAFEARRRSLSRYCRCGTVTGTD